MAKFRSKYRCPRCNLEIVFHHRTTRPIGKRIQVYCRICDKIFRVDINPPPGLKGDDMTKKELMILKGIGFVSFLYYWQIRLIWKGNKRRKLCN